MSGAWIPFLSGQTQDHLPSNKLASKLNVLQLLCLSTEECHPHSEYCFVYPKGTL